MERFTYALVLTLFAACSYRSLTDQVRHPPSSSVRTIETLYHPQTIRQYEI